MNATPTHENDPDDGESSLVAEAFDRLASEARAVSADEAFQRVRPVVPGGRSWTPMLVGAALAVLVVVGLFVARGGEDDPGLVASDPDLDGPDPTDAAGSVVTRAQLDGTAWLLAGGSGPDGPIPIVDGWPVTLTFAGETLGGSVCNGFGGEYHLDGAGRFRLGEIGSEAQLCEPAVMASEDAVSAALMAVDTIALVGGELRFTGPATELVFTRDAVVPVDLIVDRTWVLTELVQDDVVQPAGGAPATLRLDVDGTIAAGTGCRLLSGDWIVNGAEILFPSFGAEGECVPDLTDQDSLVVTVLGDGFTVVVDGDRLVLTSVGNEGLRYVLVEGEPTSSTLPERDLGAELAGTSWRMIEGTVPEGELFFDITLDMANDRGEGGGQAHCDLYAIDLGPVIDGVGTALFGDVDGTPRPCRPVGFDPGFDAFAVAVGAVDEVVLVAGELLLIGPDTEFRFVPVTEPLSVSELLDERPQTWVAVSGHPHDRGGGPYLCEEPISADGFCSGRWVVLAGDAGAFVLQYSDPPPPITVVGALDEWGRLVVDHDAVLGDPAPDVFEGYVGLPSDGEISRALLEGRLEDAALRWHPDGVLLSLGGDVVQRLEPAGQLRNSGSWLLDAEAFRGRVGPFSALHVLGGTTRVYNGTHAHCAAPPVALPDVAFDRQLVIEADGIDSCIGWWVVDVLLDSDGFIVAVNLDLWEP